MKNSQKHGVIRLGDKTSHGGVVITALDGTKALGIPVAGETCMTHCPQCKGDFEILPAGSGKRHAGKWLAYHDDLTACGATLISSI